MSHTPPSPDPEDTPLMRAVRQMKAAEAETELEERAFVRQLFGHGEQPEPTLFDKVFGPHGRLTARVTSDRLWTDDTDPAA